jgi:mannan endo-1,4-beta-mannosidase
MQPSWFIVRLLGWMLLASCHTQAQDSSLVDRDATRETKQLYRNLNRLRQQAFLFGHQDDLAYGVNWKYEKGRSDVQSVTGDYPALYGWDLGNIEAADNAKNLDGVPFDQMKKFIREGYERGGVQTISWHARSPFGYPNGAWDTTHGTVTSVLPGGVNHTMYKEWLDAVASFLGSLKSSQGKPIPVLFRPYHELTGNWFWWCRNACTADEFKTLWRFLVYYMRDVKKLHNLIYVYNVADFNSQDEFMERYPGNEWVDVISFDSYQYNDPAKDDGFRKMIDQRLTILDRIAAETGKMPAFGETGYEAIPYPTWWTDVLLRAIGEHRIAYVLLWRNHGYNEYMKKMHYYVPYTGQVSEADFIRFYESGRTVFEKEAKAAQLYQ